MKSFSPHIYLKYYHKEKASNFASYHNMRMFLLATLVYTNSVRCIDHKMKHIQYYSSCYTTLQTSRQHSFDRFRYFYHIRDHSLHYNFFRRVYRIFQQDTPLHTPPCLCGILLDNYYRCCYRSLRRNLSHSLLYMIQ